MSYTVFARKYRPQTFDELVGQEHVARTLGNAIASGRVAHAFLFTGVRGVGKTTTARLLSKALNCEKGPTASPCNACDPCRDITAGVDVDVQEIDGASNNSVDDVRRLQETLPFRPARDRFKIVIVDEVHMLSTGAFNAFLKTLEEPPEHVKFIFATTESHKVPVTIKSRCQRYDFRLIPQQVIADKVRSILAVEGVAADDGAVALVAREAAGSMRDALTLLDQLVAYGGGTLEGEVVAETLGIAGRDRLYAVARAVLEGDGASILSAVDALATNGVDMLHFARQLTELLRDLVVLRVAPSDTSLVDLVAEELALAREIADASDPLELQRAFAAVSRLVDDVGRSPLPRTVLEMGLVRVATRPPLRGVAELLGRLEALEQRLGGGGGAPPTSGGPGAGSPKRGPAGSPRSATGHAGGPSAAPLEPPLAKTVSAPTPVDAPAARPAPASVAAAPQPSFSPAVAAAMAISRQAFVQGGAQPAPDAVPERAPEATPALSAMPEPEPPSAATSPGTGLRRSAIQEWEAIVRSMRDTRPELAAILENAVPRIVTRERLVLAFREGSFYGRQASEPKNTEAILLAATAHLGARPVLELRLDAEADGAQRTVAAVEAQRREVERSARRREALNHPRVRDAIDVFPEAKGKIDVRFDSEGER